MHKKNVCKIAVEMENVLMEFAIANQDLAEMPAKKMIVLTLALIMEYVKEITNVNVSSDSEVKIVQ